jgi:hypothetical protein
MAEHGYNPSRLREGLGPAGNYRFGEAIRKAKRVEGPLQNIKDLFDKPLLKKMEFANRWNAWIESACSEMAFVKGIQTYENRLNVAGVGFDRMPTVLEQRLRAIDPGLPEAIYARLAKNANANPLEAAFEIGKYKGIDDIIPDLTSELNARGITIDDGNLRQLLTQAGLIDELRTRLSQVETPEQVRAVFADINRKINNRINELLRTHELEIMNYTHERIKAEGVQSMMEHWNGRAVGSDEFYSKSLADWEPVFEEGEHLSYNDKRALFRAQELSTRIEYNRMRDLDLLDLQGLAKAIDAADAEAQALVHAQENIIQLREAFHNLKSRLKADFFDTDWNSREASTQAWHDTQERIQEEFSNIWKTEIELEREKNYIFYDILKRQFKGKNIDMKAVATWLDNIIDRRVKMFEAVEAHYKSTMNLSPADRKAANAKFWKETYPPMIQEHTRASMTDAAGVFPAVTDPANYGNYSYKYQRYTHNDVVSLLTTYRIDSKAAWDAVYKELNAYLKPGDAPFTSLDYFITPTTVFYNKLEAALQSRTKARAEGLKAETEAMAARMEYKPAVKAEGEAVKVEEPEPVTLRNQRQLSRHPHHPAT